MSSYYLHLGNEVLMLYFSPFCAGNCWQEVEGNNNIVALNKIFFPAVDKFDVYIPAETGHNANLHHSAQEVFGRIQQWIGSL